MTLQPPTSGIHALRIGPVAVFDVALTIAFIAGVWGNLPSEWRDGRGLVLLSLVTLVVGEALHGLLRVQTPVTDALQALPRGRRGSSSAAASKK